MYGGIEAENGSKKRGILNSLLCQMKDPGFKIGALFNLYVYTIYDAKGNIFLCLRRRFFLFIPLLGTYAKDTFGLVFL